MLNHPNLAAAYNNYGILLFTKG